MPSCVCCDLLPGSYSLCVCGSACQCLHPSAVLWRGCACWRLRCEVDGTDPVSFCAVLMTSSHHITMMSQAHSLIPPPLPSPPPAIGQEGKYPVVRVWDYRTGRCLALLTAHASCKQVLVSSVKSCCAVCLPLPMGLAMAGTAILYRMFFCVYRLCARLICTP